MGNRQKEPRDCRNLIGSRHVYASLSKAALWDALCAVARDEMDAINDATPWGERAAVRHLLTKLLAPVCAQRGDRVPDPLRGLSLVIRNHGRGSKWAGAAEAEKEVWK